MNDEQQAANEAWRESRKELTKDRNRLIERGTELAEEIERTYLEKDKIGREMAEEELSEVEKSIKEIDKELEKLGDSPPF